MAATVSIVVRAINATKAVFQDVGTQAEALNKRMNKLASVFRGLFVAGIAARFTKSLLDASTYSKELEGSAGKVKSAWRDVATDIGDALAKLFMSIEPILSNAGKIAKGIIKDIRFAAAYYGALAGGATSQEAIREAEAAEKRIEQEQKVRKERQKTEDFLRAAQERNNKAAEDYDKIKARNDEREKKAQESKMANEDLLLKKLQEQIDAGAELSQLEQLGILSFPEAERAEKVRERILDLDEEIAKIRDNIAKDEADAAEAAKASAEEAKENFKKQELEKLEAAKDRIEQTTKAELESLEKQKEQALENQRDLSQAAQDIGALISDKDLLRQAKEEQRRQQRDERERQRVLERAEKNIAEGRQLSEREQLAITKRELERAAAEEQKKAEQLQKDIDAAQKKSYEDIAAIKDKIEQVLAFK